jgi:hypothetical protein
MEARVLWFAVLLFPTLRAVAVLAVHRVASCSTVYNHRERQLYLQANVFVRQEFLRLMEPQMPRALPSSFSHTIGAQYAAAVRSAVSNTLDTLNARFCEAYERSGCTCTVAVYSGSLLTVANIGDSDAVLDAFSESVTMTVCSSLICLRGMVVVTMT